MSIVPNGFEIPCDDTASVTTNSGRGTANIRKISVEFTSMSG